MECSDGMADMGKPQDPAVVARDGVATAAVARAACTARCSSLHASRDVLTCIVASDRAKGEFQRA